ncbi:membrane hypothetical protein [Tenacibaculum litopenaei]|uniref:O-antigen ligase family protein n=1 Tax=Tenacibaculum litopenaei TaxID=396016 RepID=UPI0038953EE6
MQTATTKLTAFFQKRANWNFLLLALVVGGLPFVLRLHIEKRPPESWEFKAFPYPKGNFDIFHYYKGIVLIILSFFMVVLLPKKKLRLVLKYRVLLVAFAFLILISSIFSPFRGYSLLGGAESYQGMLVWLSYVILVTSAAMLYSVKAMIRLFYVVFMAAIIMSVIGVLQYFDLDIRPYFEKVIFHSGLKMIIEKLETGTVYALAYNTNYYGVFMLCNSLVAYFLFLLNSKKQLGYLLFLGYSLVYFNLVASGSRAANVTYCMILLIVISILGIRNRELVKKSLRILVVSIFLYFFLGSMNSEDNSLNNMAIKSIAVSNLKKLEVEYNVLKVVSYDRPELHIKINDSNKLSFLNKFGESQKVHKIGNDTLGFTNKEFSFLKFSFFQKEKKKILNLIYDNWANLPLVIDKQGIYIYDKGRLLPIKNAPKIDYLNRRNSLISGRGMLWGQSLPLFKDVLTFGYGADCFPLAYPNDDYVSRIKTFGMISNSFCTSAHSLYIQIGVEFGVLALVLFILLLSWYLFDSLKLLFKLSLMRPVELICLCCFVVVLGYAVTGITNAAMLSSIINFWVFLGIGIGVNAKIKHQSINQKTN